jgi:hypothetical protein
MNPSEITIQTRAQVEAEKNFTSSLIMGLSLLGYTPTRQQVEEKAQQLYGIGGIHGE